MIPDATSTPVPHLTDTSVSGQTPPENGVVKALQVLHIDRTAHLPSLGRLATGAQWVGADYSSQRAVTPEVEIEQMQDQLLKKAGLSQSARQVAGAAQVQHGAHTLVNGDAVFDPATLLASIPAEKTVLLKTLGYFLHGSMPEGKSVQEALKNISKTQKEFDSSPGGMASSNNAIKSVLIANVSSLVPGFDSRYAKVMREHVERPTTTAGEPIPSDRADLAYRELNRKLLQLTRTELAAPKSDGAAVVAVAASKGAATPAGIAASGGAAASAGAATSAAVDTGFSTAVPVAGSPDATPKSPVAALTDMLQDSFGEQSAPLIDTTKTYLQKFTGIGDSFPLLVNALKPGELQDLMKRRRCYGSMPEGVKEKLFNERDITNIAQKKKFHDVNQDMLGCPGSFLSSAPAKAFKLLEAGRQMSWSMPTLMATPSGDVRRVDVMAVTAPALDTPQQPEWAHYVDAKGSLDEGRYRLAMETVAAHVKQGAIDCNTDRAVLSAFGMGAFVNGLNGDAKSKAMAIGKDVFCNLIQQLRQGPKPVEVAFSDLSAAGQFWRSVNATLEARGQAPVEWLGRIPGDWVKDGDMVVNPADPHSLCGNGCKHDRSADGAIGANSLVHYQHALSCRQYRH